MKYYTLVLLFLFVCASIAQTNVLPELRFTTNNPEDIDFASTEKKKYNNRPEVEGTFTLTNCDERFNMTNVPGTMKVRGNQTSGWAKKSFAIKFNTETNILGLNNGREFKKWVLLADAKDTALIRTALGLYISNAVCKDDENVWVSDFTPVIVYLNDEYWGYYYLAESKEVLDGRINLPVTPAGYNGTDIGYCFELDYYAKDEAKKSDSSPVFTVTYKPKDITYNIEKVLANFGAIKTYTMLSEITNEETQLPFIQNKIESLYTILYEAAMNGVAKTISSNGTVVDSTESLEKVITDYFDINSFADGYIINEYDCAPDVGYSSFYMSFDNSATGDKKLRFDNPWDFDSNFGNRRNFITDAEDLYLTRTSNMWLQLFSKLDFFMDIVKAKWNKLREEEVFENMLNMMTTYFHDFDSEFQRNFERWPKNDAANELREPFKSTSDYIKAEDETLNWCTKRVNYLEAQWRGLSEIEQPKVDRPVVETPVVETTVVETPVVETPVVQPPVVETPVVEPPVVETTVVQPPVVETPVVETLVVETPVVETPVVQPPVVETPVVETTVVETPVVETPVVETPVVETPVVQPPVVETPVVQPPVVQPPVVETPVVEPPVVETPVVEPPVVETQEVEPSVVETPVVQPPVVETPVVETPVVETPVVQPPVVETPVVETPVVETSVVQPPVVETPVVEPPVIETPEVEPPVIETPVVETPVVQPPVVETTVVEPPVIETPVVEPPVIETPVVEPPVVETTVVQPPVVETTVVQPPVVETTVVQPPVVQTPVVQPPVVQPPVVQTPAVLPWRRITTRRPFGMPNRRTTIRRTTRRVRWW